MAKPLEFPDWATNGFPSAIDQPFASLPRKQTGWEQSDVPSPNTQNGLHFWTAAWLEYLAQQRWKPVDLSLFQQVAGPAATFNNNTWELSLPGGTQIQIFIKVDELTQVSAFKARHVDGADGQLRFQSGTITSTPGTAVTAITAPALLDFPITAVWITDLYDISGTPHIAAENDTMIVSLMNIGVATVKVHRLLAQRDFV